MVVLSVQYEEGELGPTSILIRPCSDAPIHHPRPPVFPLLTKLNLDLSSLLDDLSVAA